MKSYKKRKQTGVGILVCTIAVVLASAAARAGKPGQAVDALMMDVNKNNYSKCGINTGGPVATYFPGNGGLLYAVAMMAAGWDDAPDKHAPGFPDDGSWVVRHEGLMKAQ